MREIKFRAMPEDLSYGMRWVYGNLIYKFNGEPAIATIGKDGLTHITCFKDSEGQFTGLKDKNGKEIYEGDIVKVGTIELPLIVSFGNGCFWISTKQVSRHCFKIFEMEFEVIGNIYENPELLGDLK